MNGRRGHESENPAAEETDQEERLRDYASPPCLLHELDPAFREPAGTSPDGLARPEPEEKDEHQDEQKG